MIGGTAKQAFTVAANAGIGRFAPVADRLPLATSLPEVTPIVTVGAIFASSEADPELHQNDKLILFSVLSVFPSPL